MELWSDLLCCLCNTSFFLSDWLYSPQWLQHVFDCRWRHFLTSFSRYLHEIICICSSVNMHIWTFLTSKRKNPYATLTIRWLGILMVINFAFNHLERWSCHFRHQIFAHQMLWIKVWFIHAALSRAWWCACQKWNKIAVPERNRLIQPPRKVSLLWLFVSWCRLRASASFWMAVYWVAKNETTLAVQTSYGPEGSSGTIL